MSKCLWKLSFFNFRSVCGQSTDWWVWTKDCWTGTEGKLSNSPFNPVMHFYSCSWYNQPRKINFTALQSHSVMLSWRINNPIQLIKQTSCYSFIKVKWTLVVQTGCRQSGAWDGLGYVVCFLFFLNGWNNIHVINFEILFLVWWRIPEQTGGTNPPVQVWRENGWASSRATGFQITGTSPVWHEAHLITQLLEICHQNIPVS